MFAFENHHAEAQKLKKKEQHIARCLDLAVRGLGFVSPNPMVGCVIVKDGHVVGEGYHRRFGGSHAEMEALRRAGSKAKGATLYVNLEPCAHRGKTPPCAEAIIGAGIRKVVTSCVDPNPLVSGKGIRLLRRSGVAVEVGVLRGRAEALNKKFFTFMRTGLPYVGIKIAQTLDGRIADGNGNSKWITSTAARQEAHRIRAQYDAILVGAETVAKDNPELTVRLAKGRNPLRVVIDPGLRSDVSSHIFDLRAANTVVFTTEGAMVSRKQLVKTLVRKGVFVLGMENGPEISLMMILRSLGTLGVSSVLVEGGSITASKFLEGNLAQKLHWFISPRILGSGLSSVVLKKPLHLGESLRLNNVEIMSVDSDVLIEGSL